MSVFRSLFLPTLPVIGLSFAHAAGGRPCPASRGCAGQAPAPMLARPPTPWCSSPLPQTIWPSELWTPGATGDDVMVLGPDLDTLHTGRLFSEPGESSVFSSVVQDVLAPEIGVFLADAVVPKLIEPGSVFQVGPGVGPGSTDEGGMVLAPLPPGAVMGLATLVLAAVARRRHASTLDVKSGPVTAPRDVSQRRVQQPPYPIVTKHIVIEG